MRSLNHRTAGLRPWLHGLAALGLLGLGACAPQSHTMEPRPVAKPAVPAAEADTRADAVRRDPKAYLQTVRDKCRGLEQYELVFVRQERRGLIPRLQDPEHIRCRFRRRPFSVRMEWLDEKSKYRESTYVENQVEGRLRIVTRRWAPPLLPPPAVNRLDIHIPVTFGESKRPISDFGLEAMMERTLAAVRDAGGQVLITYVGLRELPEGGPTVHALRIEYSPGIQAVPVHELFIDVRTDLPAGSILRQASGEIDSSYFYRDLNTDVRFTDADFVLPEEAQAAASQPAGASE